MYTSLLSREGGHRVFLRDVFPLATNVPQYTNAPKREMRTADAYALLQPKILASLEHRLGWLDTW